jgi:glycosyltransferase involved in cell wall biosynthesis
MTIIPYNIIFPGQLQASGRLGLNIIPHSCRPPSSLVSAVMVTRGNLELVSRSLRMFNAQSWLEKELIIVTDNVTEELKRVVSGHASSILLVEAPRGLSLGDYRNISVARARGNFVCQWDDDDFYHRDRISSMMTVLLETNVDAVFLSRWLMCWESRRTLAVSSPRIWEGSFVARKSVMRVYPATERGEDTEMVNNLVSSSRIAMVDAPHLYCYSVTGSNTWGEAHFDDLFRAAEKIYSGPQYQEALDSLECFEILRNSRLGCE